MNRLIGITIIVVYVTGMVMALLDELIHGGR